MEMLEQFLSNTSTVASVQAKGIILQVYVCKWLLGSGPLLLLGQFSCGNRKSTVRKCPVSVMQEEGEERQSLGVKSWPLDIVIPVVQNLNSF